MINNQSRTGQTFWLGIGSLVSFSFGIVSAAILSRLLSVDEYGTYRQVLYVYNTLLIVFTLGLPRAYSFFLARIPIEEGKSAISKINLLFILLGSFFSLLLFFGSNIIGKILHNPSLPICLRYFSLAPLFLMPVLGFESILATYKKSIYATFFIILTRTFNLVCTVMPVIIWHGGAIYAIIGFTVSSGICCIIGLYFERIPFKGKNNQKSNLLLSEVIKYALPLLLASLGGILINSAPQFFISRWYGTDAFAAFANGFIELPFAGMVIGAVATVLLPEISRLSKEESKVKDIVNIWQSSLKKSAQIIYPLAVFACVFAPQIIEILYGDKYTAAVPYFRIIIIINLVRVVPYAPVMMGMNMTKQYFIANFIPAILLIGLDYIWVNNSNSPYGIAFLQCLAIVLHVLIMFIYIARKTKIPMRKMIPISYCLKILLIAFISSILPYSVLSFLSSGIPEVAYLIIGGVLCVIIYFPIITYIKIDYSSLLKPLIKRN